AADTLDQAAFDAFTARRYDRAKTVVDASVQLGQWMLDGVEGNVPALVGKVMAVVSQPA
ncbi:MAG: 2-polyprenyl-6-methoxyphenol hydroxylase, partial [Actinobacteria bacterium]|nr:2-polyprenyl-6-methoxyphenol hydroxylase [Actinomycetota bacterium]